MSATQDVHALLAALREALAAYDVETRLDATTLIVIGARADGGPRLADTIACRERPDGRLWFHTSWGEPLSLATEPGTAAVKIAAYLGG